MVNSPLAELLEDYSIRETLSTDSYSLQHAVTPELLQDQVGIQLSCLRGSDFTWISDWKNYLCLFKYKTMKLPSSRGLGWCIWQSWAECCAVWSWVLPETPCKVVLLCETFPSWSLKHWAWSCPSSWLLCRDPPLGPLTYTIKQKRWLSSMCLNYHEAHVLFLNWGNSLTSHHLSRGLAQTGWRSCWAVRWRCHLGDPCSLSARLWHYSLPKKQKKKKHYVNL